MAFCATSRRFASYLAPLDALQRQLTRRPHSANAVLATVIMGLGDTAAQRIQCEEEPFRLDLVRSAVMSSWACLFFSPLCVFMYPHVARIPFHSYIRTTLGVNVARAAATNLVMAVPFNAAFFVYATSLEYHLRRQVRRAEDRGREEQAASKMEGWMPVALEEKIREKLSNALLPTVMTSACFWIPMTTLNFQFVSDAYRVVCTSLLAVMWNTLLSLIQHSTMARGMLPSREWLRNPRDEQT